MRIGVVHRPAILEHGHHVTHELRAAVCLERVEIPAAAQVGGTVGAALEEEREVKALVVERRSETVDDLRHRGVTDPRHVGLGDLAVVVEVFVADVAGTQLLLVQAELRIVVGHVVQLLLREEVHGTVAHGQSVTHAALILPRIGIVLAVVDHLVAGKGEVSANGDGEVFAETLDVFGRNLEAAVLHQTHVGVVGIILGKPRNLRELGCEEDVFTPLVEEVGIDFQLVEKPGFDTDVVFGRHLPRHVLVGHATFADTAGPLVEVDAEVAVTVGAAVDRSQVDETRTGDLVVADLPDRRTDLEPRQHLAVAQEALLGGHPADSHGGEYAHALALGEVLRTVETDVGLDQVTLVVGIGKTAGKAERTVGQRLEVIARSLLQPVILGEAEQQAADLVLFAERPAVIDRRLDVLRTGTVAGLFVIQVLLFLVGLPLGADQFAVLIASRGLKEVDVARTLLHRIIHGVVGVAHLGRKTRGDEREILIDRQVGAKRIAGGLLPTALREHVIGVVQAVAAGQLAVLEADGESVRRRVDDVAVDGCRPLDGLHVLGHVALHAEVHHRGLGDVHVDVGAEVIALVVDILAVTADLVAHP